VKFPKWLLFAALWLLLLFPVGTGSSEEPAGVTPYGGQILGFCPALLSQK
jgi:hypothetical protein